MLSDVVWISTRKESPARNYWDQTLLEYVFKNKTHHESIGKLKRAIVVCPSEYQDVNLVNKQIAKLDEVIFIATSDECNKFDLSKLEHPNIKVYSNYPHDTDADVTWLPIGYTPHSKTDGWLEKDIDVLFAGQVNHDSREKMIRQVSNIPTSELHISKGFSQGLGREQYINKTRRAKVIPCPKGNISPDSFRMYEALEHGALPVCEDNDFFNKLFDNPPFPVTDNPKQWEGYCRDALSSYPKVQNDSSAWWQRYKEWLWSEFNEPDDITVVIPVSPIKSHPETYILDETIKSIRAHLDCRIIITFDGVREEQEDKRQDYELFINNVLSSGYDRIYPIIFKEHQHQSGMMRAVLEHIKTPYILYVEQDTPLTPDKDIEWEGIKDSVANGIAHMVRLSHEANILKEHEYLMIGDVETVGHIKMIKTFQYSQRPHIASTAFYKHLMDSYFSEKSNTFIEDRLYGLLLSDVNLHGLQAWNIWRTWIYHPDGDIKRSYHTDGREGEKKYDDRLVF